MINIDNIASILILIMLFSFKKLTPNIKMKSINWGDKSPIKHQII